MSFKKKMKQKDWILIEIQEKTDGDFGLFKQIFSAILYSIQIVSKLTTRNWLPGIYIEGNIENWTETYILTESALTEPIRQNRFDGTDSTEPIRRNRSDGTDPTEPIRRNHDLLMIWNPVPAKLWT